MRDSEDLVDSFAANFLGYGTWSAPFWFVGMEEGGVRTLDEFECRLRAWEEEERPELVDLFRYHDRIRATEWFSDSAPLQKTWRPLIRALHIAHGVDAPSTETLRTYQRTRLGRADGETALIELLPFPSSSTRKWLYKSLDIPKYACRRAYRDALTPQRFTRIVDRIHQHRPATVVFYGNPRYWRAQLSLQPVANNIHCRREGSTLLIATTHPTAHGTTNAHWDEIGRMMRSASTTRQT